MAMVRDFLVCRLGRLSCVAWFCVCCVVECRVLPEVAFVTQIDYPCIIYMSACTCVYVAERELDVAHASKLHKRKLLARQMPAPQLAVGGWRRGGVAQQHTGDGRGWCVASRVES